MGMTKMADGPETTDVEVLNPRYAGAKPGNVHDVAQGVATKMLMASRARRMKPIKAGAKEPKAAVEDERAGSKSRD